MKRIIYYTLFITVILFGCSEYDNHNDHAHVHDAKLQLVGYSNNFEVFAESDPFILGSNSTILTHVTSLDDFKPIDKCSITVSLIVGTKGIRQTSAEPIKLGIYEFTLQPEVEGKGKLIFSITTEKGEDKIEIYDIEVFSDEHLAHHTVEEPELSGITAIHFTKEQSWKVAFATDIPKMQRFGDIIKTVAQVQSAQGDEAFVVAKSNGIILFNNLVEGKNVSNGQTLASISGKGFTDNSSAYFIEAQNNYEKAKANYDRANELSNEKIISGKDLLQYKMEFENAKTVFDNLKNSFNNQGETVSSPMTGFVKQLFIKSGQYIEAGQPIASISQNKVLMLKAEVQQRYASTLRTVNSANIRTTYNDKTYNLEELNGKILSYGKAVKDDDYLLPITLQINNIGDFISGSFVELYLKSTTNTQTLTIPVSALTEEQGHFFVYVQQTPELFEKREVQVGASDGVDVEIINGINETERVVTKGAVLVKLAQSAGTLDAHSGHVH